MLCLRCHIFKTSQKLIGRPEQAPQQGAQQEEKQEIITSAYMEADVKHLLAPANGVKEEIEKGAAAEKQPKFVCYEVVVGVMICK